MGNFKLVCHLNMEDREKTAAMMVLAPARRLYLHAGISDGSNHGYNLWSFSGYACEERCEFILMQMVAIAKSGAQKRLSADMAACYVPCFDVKPHKEFTAVTLGGPSWLENAYTFHRRLVLATGSLREQY